MTVLRRLIGGFKDNSSEEKDQEIHDVVSAQQMYGSLAMHVVILCLAIYIIKIKRWSRFEWTILVCMFLKYLLYEVASLVAT